MEISKKEREYANHKRYRDKNRERLNAKSKERYRNNRDAISHNKTINRLNNIEECLKKEKQYRSKNRASINALMNKRRRGERDKCLEYLGGKKCVLCGFESEFGCQFDIHHYKGDKEFSISSKISNGFLFGDEIKKELDKCVIVCRNCHSLIGSSLWKENDFPEELKNKIFNLTNKQ